MEGEPVTLGILDHPGNPGFPTYWHARGYGLFAANPLGQAALSDGKERLNFALEPRATATFRHRILIASGTLTPEQVEARYQEFAALEVTCHVGLLGAGNISRTHGRAAAELPGVKVVGGRRHQPREDAARWPRSTARPPTTRSTRSSRTGPWRRCSSAALRASTPTRRSPPRAPGPARAVREAARRPATEQVDALLAGAAERAGVKLGVMFQDRTKPDLRRLK